MARVSGYRGAFLLGLLAGIWAAGCSSAERHAGRLSSMESRDYPVELAAGDYLRVEVRQQGVDLVVELLDPEGRKAAEFDTPNGSQGVEILEAVAGETGLHRVRLSDPVAHGDSGAYEIEIHAPGPASARQRASAQGRQEAFRHYLATLPGAERWPCDRHCRQHQIELWRRVGDLHWQAFALNDLAGHHLRRGETDLAEASFEEAREVADPESPRNLAVALNGLGMVRWHQGRLAESRDLCRQAVEELETQPASSIRDNNLAAAHNCVGVAQRRLARFAEAAASLDLSMELAHRGGAWTVYGDSATTRVLLHLDGGRFAEAVELADEALPVVRGVGAAAQQAKLTLYRANALWGLGQPQEAVDGLRQALAQLRELGDSAELVALSTLANSLGDLGRFDEAVATLSQAVAAMDAERQPVLWAEASTELGRALLRAGSPRRALEVLQPVYEASRQRGEPRQAAMALLAIGSSRLALEEPEAALAVLEESLQAARGAADRQAQVLALSRLGEAQAELGRSPEARASWQRALNLSRETSNPMVRAALLSRLAGLSREAGDLEGSFGLVREAIELDEGLRSVLLSPELRADYLASRRGRYELAVDLGARLAEQDPDGDYLEEAFLLSEKARARGLSEELAASRSDWVSGVPEGLIEREREIQRRLSWVQQRWLRGLSGGAADGEVEELATLRRAALDDLTTLREDFRRQAPRYARLRYPEPPSLGALQERLRDEVAVLEYVYGSEEVFLFVVTRGERRLLRLGEAREIGDALEGYFRALRSRRSSRGLSRLGHALHESLVAPALPWLEEQTRLVIIPDGLLYYLPFEALLTRPAAGEGLADLPYLLRRFEISYAPSVVVLAALEERRVELAGRRGGQPAEVFLVADPDLTNLGGGEAASLRLPPLPAAAEEARRLAALFPADRVETLLGAAATEAGLAASAGLTSARRLHFATHGLLGEEDGENLGLLLAAAPGAPEDGLLQIHEISRLDLNAELVVLSACESGLGRAVAGEGLLNLSRAFFFAGSPNLVVSLWRVGDTSTADFMEAFYRGLRDGASAPSALRRAKLELLRAGRFPHPNQWAPFVLVGSGSEAFVL